MTLKYIKDLSHQYYKFILKYEEIIPKVEPILISKLSKKELEIYNYMKEKRKTQFRPWKSLDQENLPDSLKKEFLSKGKNLINYVIAEDGLDEQLYVFGCAELEKYYNDNNIVKEQEELSEEMQNYKFNDTLNKEIFSEELISIFNLYKELRSLTPKVYEYHFQEGIKKVMPHEQAKDLAEKYFAIISDFKCNNVDTKINKFDITAKEKEIIIPILKYFDCKVSPWKYYLEKGKEIQDLTDIFEYDLKEATKYFKIYDITTDNYFSSAFDELSKYYQDMGVKKTDDEILEEMQEFERIGIINTNIFSNDVVDTFNDMMKLKPIYDVFEKLTIEQYHQHLEEPEKDITDDFC